MTTDTTTPSESAPTLLTGRLVTDGGIVPDGAVIVVGDRIAWSGAKGELPAEFRSAATPRGWRDDLTLLPGLVDIHCHGGGGGEFGPDASAATPAIDHHHRSGTTSLVASLVSAPREAMLAGIDALVPRATAGDLAGIHLEGPFLSHARCGAQDPEALGDPDPAFIDAAGEAARGWLAQMTFAPELAGADAVPARLARWGALGAVGHTDAEWAVAAAALAGASEGVRGGRPLVTHLFNGMPPMHHRAPGPVAAALSAAARGEAVVEVIADGVHLADGTVRMVFDTVGPANIALVSDAMAAAGLPEGDYTLGRFNVRVSGREARLEPGGSLAGGVSTLLEQVRWLVRDLGISLEDAVAAASLTPATALALDDVGSLAAGKLADVVVVDDSLELQRVLRRGARIA
ncbi:amidohydrolase family protein [Knoellia koreensis]|uniref:Amidohydrolase family protein n=1 Tax=Knoellia koreensis TaxID=2730921 RepID=A0A849HE81_9MICO|nr:amidohydrolase family protein [Knoellia sp. DB2414S]